MYTPIVLFNFGKDEGERGSGLRKIAGWRTFPLVAELIAWSANIPALSYSTSTAKLGDENEGAKTNRVDK
jgi:hypothetical protein